MISIRSATLVDAFLLSELGRKAFYEAFGAFNNPDDMQAYLEVSFQMKNIELELADKSISYLIANYQNTPVGYAKLKRSSNFPGINSKSQILLERIYALDAYIGKKVGKALMEKSIEIAKDELFEYMWLSVWQENNRAVTFYNKWNFKIIGYKKFKIGKEINDDFVMALKL